MPLEDVTDDEILNLAIEMTVKYPHLKEDTHLRIVQGGYGNYFGKEYFRAWYDETIPLLKQEMVNSDEDISWILIYDSYMVPEAGVKPICKILRERDTA